MERNQTQKVTGCPIPFIWSIHETQLHGDRTKIAVQWGRKQPPDFLLDDENLELETLTAL